MRLRLIFSIIFFMCMISSISAPSSSALPVHAPDWSSTATIPETGRPNPYQWDEVTLQEKIQKGRVHAVDYPVEITGLLIPARPVMKILNLEPGDPRFGWMKFLLSLSSDFKNFKGFWEWLGLNDYPETEQAGIPFTNGIKPEYPMGVSVIRKNGADGFTLSCAACHTSTLFGKPILGMTNRFPRANLFFIHGQSALEKVSSKLFSKIYKTSDAETAMYEQSREKIGSVGLKRPQALGLDSSLSQVALSLAKRAPTEWAERTAEDQAHPRPNLLDHLVADSKPAVWWNVKYKTHWLADGSVLSGNPVFTNFLWNEIGRGGDLPPLVQWLNEHSDVVEELTTAVFATEAPKWKYFFGPASINITRAKRGEQIFSQTCTHCHGEYQKAWSLKTMSPGVALFDTIQTRYTESVKDVGTDSGRREGMQALADALNPLAFSKTYQIVIEPQAGYVPPPLDGIWARYPYLHNNSIPNLCALMTPPEARPQIYFSGKPIDRDLDFSQECVGYPLGSAVPATWKKDTDHRFDTHLPGLSNQGHYDRIFRDARGQERLTSEQKKDLLEYLKTL